MTNIFRFIATISFLFIAFYSHAGVTDIFFDNSKTDIKKSAPASEFRINQEDDLCYIAVKDGIGKRTIDALPSVIKDNCSSAKFVYIYLGVSTSRSKAAVATKVCDLKSALLDSNFLVCEIKQSSN